MVLLANFHTENIKRKDKCCSLQYTSKLITKQLGNALKGYRKGKLSPDGLVRSGYGLTLVRSGNSAKPSASTCNICLSSRFSPVHLHRPPPRPAPLSEITDNWLWLMFECWMKSCCFFWKQGGDAGGWGGQTNQNTSLTWKQIFGQRQ